MFHYLDMLTYGRSFAGENRSFCGFSSIGMQPKQIDHFIYNSVPKRHQKPRLF